MARGVAVAESAPSVSVKKNVNVTRRDTVVPPPTERIHAGVVLFNIVREATER